MLAGTAASAQERIRTQVRAEQRIVIPQDVIVELRRVLDAAIGESLSREITRDISREIGRDIGRSVAYLARGLEDVRAAAYGDAQNRDFKVEQKDTETKTLALGPTGQ